MKQKIGFFGGTFDPIHLGHLNLAVELCEKGKLDEVWFCPAAQNPLKPTVSLASATHRLKMLELALRDFPSFKILDHELIRIGPSYTIDTLQYLTSKEKDKQFYLLLGEDFIASFNQWRFPLEIVKLVPLLVGSRTLYRSNVFKGDSPIAQAIEKGWTQTALFDVSATEIRRRLKEKLPCSHLVSKEVLDYIEIHHIY